MIENRHRRASVPTLAFLALISMGADAATVSGRVAGPDGKGIPHAVVFVQAPALPLGSAELHLAEMNQINKTFVPAVLPILAGTRVHFPNKDQIHHHVYSFSRTKTFELPLYRGEDAKPVLFDKPGVVKLGCNIHDWMSAVILVLPTPHFATTDDDGRYALRGMPSGEYTVTAWHAQSREKTDDLARSLRVAGSDVAADFRITLGERQSRPAQHGARTDP